MGFIFWALCPNLFKYWIFQHHKINFTWFLGTLVFWFPILQWSDESKSKRSKSKNFRGLLYHFWKSAFIFEKFGFSMTIRNTFFTSIFQTKGVYSIDGSWKGSEKIFEIFEKFFAQNSAHLKQGRPEIWLNRWANLARLWHFWHEWMNEEGRTGLTEQGYQNRFFCTCFIF